MGSIRQGTWLRRVATTGLAVVSTVLLAASSCGNDPPSAADRESEERSAAYDEITRLQPKVEGKYSPTRANINRWKATWMQGPRLAYVYLVAVNGQLTGYYVLDGPPTSYCVRISRPYEWVDIPNDGSDAETMAPAPADDAVWYTGDGACTVYYGYEAVTGAYREWSESGGISHILSSEPLPRDDVEPIGISIQEAQEGFDD